MELQDLINKEKSLEKEIMKTQKQIECMRKEKAIQSEIKNKIKEAFDTPKSKKAVLDIVYPGINCYLNDVMCAMEDGIFLSDFYDNMGIKFNNKKCKAFGVEEEDVDDLVTNSMIEHFDSIREAIKEALDNIKKDIETK